MASHGLKRQEFEGLDTKVDGKLMIICFNVPKRKNAITNVMYQGLTHFLTAAAEDENITVVAITGTGDFFSSGNDFGAVLRGDSDSSTDPDPHRGLKIVQSFIDMVIDFPKPLVAVVNGNAIGVAVTILGLMDLVYATDQAWLHTPFTMIGLCPEGCSSFTFPQIMGAQKASELLLLGKKVTTTEAEKLGLVTEVLPSAIFESVVWPKIKHFSELPPLSLKHGKQLCRDINREILHKTNHAECEMLKMLTGTEQTREALFKWFTRDKSKL